MRASSYNIYVPLPDDPEHELLVHGYTGAIDVVTKEVAEYIRSLKSIRIDGFNGNSYTPSLETIETLKRRGYITSLTKEEEEAFFVEVAVRLQAHNLISPPSYVFMLTYDCNLRCPYCYQKGLRLDTRPIHLINNKKEFFHMTKEMVDNIFEGIRDIESVHVNGKFIKRRKITFYGGEPLRSANRDIVEYIMAQAQKYGDWDAVSFEAVTNGTELHDYEDLLGVDGISFLQITLDGPPQIHDKLRVYADGRGSFEHIAKNITMALEKGARVSLRVNVDRKNIVHLPELADIIVEQGWHKHKSLFSVYVAPIHQGAANGGCETKFLFNTWELHQEIEALKDQYPHLHIFSVGRYNLLKDKVLKLMKEQDGHLHALSPAYCGAHTGMYVIDPVGDVYACWERTGDPNIRIGSIRGGRFVRTGMYHMWKSRHVVSNVVCRRCPYALFCGGGCASRACIANGNMFTRYCDGFKQFFHQAVQAAYEDFLANRTEQETAPTLCAT